MVEARTREPWVIALASQKGGVGKTTLALELAAVFADTSGRALVVDIDPQRTAEEIVTASSGVAFDFAAEDDPIVLERLRTLREYDAIIVDCPGSLEGTETLAGVLASATFAVIPMIPERAAVQPTLRTARLCADHKVPHRVVINLADPLRGAGPLESAWQLLDDLEVPRMVSFVRRYVAHSQAQLDGRMITDYRGDRSWTAALADVRRVQAELLLELGEVVMGGQRRQLGYLAEEASKALEAAATRPDSPAKPDRPAKAAEPASPEKATVPGDMTMRSWYMPKSSADRLAGLVDDVHFATRLPKHIIMGALVNVAERYQAEIEAEARSAAGQ